MVYALLALALAAAPAREEELSITPNEAQKLALADAKLYAKRDPKGVFYQRYFRLTTPRADRVRFLTTFCAHLNKLSTRKRFAWPTLVTEDLLRIDVRNYDWDQRGEGAALVLLVYEKLAGEDPWFHQQAEVTADSVELDVAWPGGYDSRNQETYSRGVYEVTFKKGRTVPRPAAWLDQKDADELRKVLCTEAPILDAEWLLGQTIRQQTIYGVNEPGFGYYDFLALTDRDAMFDLVGTSYESARKRKAIWKGAVLRSKVARHNRLTFKYGAQNRFLWGTFDTANPRARGDLLTNLLSGEFLHNAEEYMFALPNSLDGNLLCNDKGVRQATAPDNIIGSDRSKLLRDSDAKYSHNDTPVHTNLSCARCHAEDDLLKSFTDSVRETFREGPLLAVVAPKDRDRKEFEDDYLTDLDVELKRDREVYAHAIKSVTTSKAYPDGWTVQEWAKNYSGAFDAYAYAPIDAARAASELGVPRKKMLDGVAAHAGKFGRGATDVLIARWLKDPTLTMSRQQWEQRIALADALSRGVAPPEKITERKVKP